MLNRRTHTGLEICFQLFRDKDFPSPSRLFIMKFENDLCATLHIFNPGCCSRCIAYPKLFAFRNCRNCFRLTRYDLHLKQRVTFHRKTMRAKHLTIFNVCCNCMDFAIKFRWPFISFTCKTDFPKMITHDKVEQSTIDLSQANLSQSIVKIGFLFVIFRKCAVLISCIFR